MSINTDFGAFIGNSSFAEDIKKVVSSIKNNTASVLVTGERGSGKKTFAQFLHFNCVGTPDGFYSFNSFDFCEHIPADFVASVKNNGCEAKKMTVYIGQSEKLASSVQLELLEFIKFVRRQQFDIRFVFGAENTLEEAVENGTFLKELFYCMSTLCVNIIPLRSRKDDIPVLADFFLGQFKKEYGVKTSVFSDAAVAQMQSYFWPGNVAELKNAVERAVILCHGEQIKSLDLGIMNSASSENLIQGELEQNMEDKNLKTAMDSFKREYVTKILEECSWNQTKTAKVLGIQRTYVIKLINELDIRKK